MLAANLQQPEPIMTEEYNSIALTPAKTAKLKIGDKIVCIKSGDFRYSLEVDKVYEIIGFYETKNGRLKYPAINISGTYPWNFILNDIDCGCFSNFDSDACRQGD
jgi:hypothetical protein